MLTASRAATEAPQKKFNESHKKFVRQIRSGEVPVSSATAKAIIQLLIPKNSTVKTSNGTRNSLIWYRLSSVRQRLDSGEMKEDMARNPYRDCRCRDVEEDPVELLSVPAQPKRND